MSLSEAYAEMHRQRDAERARVRDEAIADLHREGYRVLAPADVVGTTSDVALASVLRKLLEHSFAAMDSHDRANGRPVRFTLDDTRVSVTPAEETALKEVLGW